MTAKEGDAVMRFVLCILLAILLPGSAWAAKETMSLQQAQAAAAQGDADASAAVATTVDQRTCLNGCANRGYDQARCTNACRPGLCHPGAETPYCVR
jgi:hypothetical protein